MRTLVRSALVWLAAAAPLQAEELGIIRGQIGDEAGGVASLGEAVVFVCDAATGRPLVATSYRPLGAGSVDGVSGLDDLLHGRSSPDGLFEIQAPPGNYRLIGQSWVGVAGIPDRKNSSQVVMLLGTSERVTLTEKLVTAVFLKPLGSGRATLVTDPEEAGAYLVVSTAPMQGDPILGFWGWGPSFTRHAIGVTHLAHPQITILGLPDAQDVHVGLFAYDNLPGFGGATLRANQAEPVSIPIYAGWSNGKDTPPESLKPLVAYFEGHSFDLAHALDLDSASDASPTSSNSRARLMEAVMQSPDELIRIEGVGEYRAIDVLAAQAYRQLREYHQQRTRPAP